VTDGLSFPTSLGTSSPDAYLTIDRNAVYVDPDS
jgi:hypothetical protein